MATWPFDTSENPNETVKLLPGPVWDGMTIEAQDVTLRSVMDSGPSKTRPKSTKASITFSATWMLNTDQLDVFIDFWENTIGQGSGSFAWYHPITNKSLSAKFVGGYSITPVGGPTLVKHYSDPDKLRIWGIWKITAKLECY